MKIPPIFISANSVLTLKKIDLLGWIQYSYGYHRYFWGCKICDLSNKAIFLEAKNIKDIFDRWSEREILDFCYYVVSSPIQLKLLGL
jgi:hypothetical protein